ncbi:MAG TPA: ABC transporter substrate-binding protein [Candidatus Dormibacteraeota bacterium]|jgi:peptide/nickel transport system substrate-binding protein|nr:ABC transporter substrate-binding protein [Candidatus Dormibacteraeota bacterium]
MSRSHPLAILFAAALLVAAACSAPTAPGTSGSAAPSATGGQAGTLVYYADVSDLISLDPAVAYEFSGVLLVHNAYETLVQFQGSDLSNLKPALATKWDIKDAGSNWQISFDLRSGAKFASGNPITADDVVYSLQRVIKLNKSPAFLFTDIAQLKADSVTASGANTVVITMPKTASPQGLLSILTFTVGSVVDSKEVKSHETGGDSGSAWLLDRSAGSGPYNIDHWTKNAEVLLKANASYGGTKPNLSQILIKHVPESTNQQFALERGDADVARNLSPQQIAAEQGKQGVTTTKGDSLQLVYVGMNVMMKPLDNVKVREALRSAIDYNGIVNDLLKGNAKKVQGIVPAGLAGHNPDAPFQQDVSKAKSLLAEGGQPNGFSTELLVPTGPAPGGAQWSDIAAKLQDDWKKIGVNVQIKQTTQAELLTTYRAQKGQLVLILWGPDFPDPDANAGPFTDYAAKSIAWRNGWNDTTIADKAKKAALITDASARNTAYKEITDYVLHNGPYAVLYQPTENFGLRSNVKGFAWNPMGYLDFAAITK